MSRFVLQLSALIVCLTVFACGQLDSDRESNSNTSELQELKSSVGGYSCEQQASWGKCGEAWMHPSCDYACPTIRPSVGGYTCEQQASWGKCRENWMHPVCDYVCRPNGGLVRPDLGAHNGPYHGGGYGNGGYTNGGLIYPDLGAHNGGGYGGGYTNGGLIYPDLGAHNGPYGGGYGGRL